MVETLRPIFFGQDEMERVAQKAREARAPVGQHEGCFLCRGDVSWGEEIAGDPGSTQKHGAAKEADSTHGNCGPWNGTWEG